jgi:hypothetical protein
MNEIKLSARDMRCKADRGGVQVKGVEGAKGAEGWME